MLKVKNKSNQTKLENEIREVNKINKEKNILTQEDNTTHRWDIYNIDAQRASFKKHLRSKKRLQNEKQKELVIPEWLFQEPFEIKARKIYNPDSLRQIARENNKMDDKQF